MNPSQALLASLARSRAQAHAAFDRWVEASLAPTLQAAVGSPVEHITVEPPVWCHACNRILADTGHLDADAAQITVLCPACAARRWPDRRDPATARLRELVEVTRLLAWQAQDTAATYASRGCHESARVQRELAEAANHAIEALRINREDI